MEIDSYTHTLRHTLTPTPTHPPAHTPEPEQLREGEGEALKVPFDVITAELTLIVRLLKHSLQPLLNTRDWIKRFIA